MNKDNNTMIRPTHNHSILATKRISCANINLIPRNKRPYKYRRNTSNYMSIEN